MPRKNQYYMGKDKLGRMRRLRREMPAGPGMRARIGTGIRGAPAGAMSGLRSGARRVGGEASQFGKYLKREYSPKATIKSARATGATLKRGVQGIGKAGFVGKAKGVVSRNAKTLTRGNRLPYGVNTTFNQIGLGAAGFSAGRELKYANDRRTGKRKAGKDDGLGQGLGIVGGSLAAGAGADYGSQKLIGRMTRKARLNAVSKARNSYGPQLPTRKESRAVRKGENKAARAYNKKNAARILVRKRQERSKSALGRTVNKAQSGALRLRRGTKDRYKTAATSFSGTKFGQKANSAGRAVGKAGRSVRGGAMNATRAAGRAVRATPGAVRGIPSAVRNAPKAIRNAPASIRSAAGRVKAKAGAIRTSVNNKRFNSAVRQATSSNKMSQRVGSIRLTRQSGEARDQKLMRKAGERVRAGASAVRNSKPGKSVAGGASNLKAAIARKRASMAVNKGERKVKRTASNVIKRKARSERISRGNVKSRTMAASSNKLTRRIGQARISIASGAPKRALRNAGRAVGSVAMRGVKGVRGANYRAIGRSAGKTGLLLGGGLVASAAGAYYGKKLGSRADAAAKRRRSQRS